MNKEQEEKLINEIAEDEKLADLIMDKTFWNKYLLELRVTKGCNYSGHDISPRQTWKEMWREFRYKTTEALFKIGSLSATSFSQHIGMHGLFTRELRSSLHDSLAQKGATARKLFFKKFTCEFNKALQMVDEVNEWLITYIPPMEEDPDYNPDYNYYYLCLDLTGHVRISGRRDVVTFQNTTEKDIVAGQILNI